MEATIDFNNPTELEKCILQLTQANTDQIKQAEIILKAYLKKPDSIQCVIMQLQHSAHPQVRQYAAILLRKRIFKHWNKLDEPTKHNIKHILLNRALEENIRIVRFNIVDLIAAIAIRDLPVQKWPELFGYVTNCLQSTVAEHREISMYLLRLLAEQAGTYLQTMFTSIKSLYANALQDTESLHVRIAAMRAACSIIEFLEETDLREFQNLVPLMMNVLQQCLTNGAEQEAAEFLDAFSDVASNPFPIMDQSLPTFIDLLLQVLKHNEFESSIHASASFVIGEFIARKPKTIGKTELVPKILSALLDILAQDELVSCGRIPELLQLDEGNKEGDDDEESVGYLAQQMLDTLALNVPAKYLKSVVFEIVQAYVSSQDPRKRKAATLALAILAEGCSEIMCKRLDELMAAVYQMAQDSDQRVREAACFALGQFAEFLQPDISKYYDHMLPVCLSLVDDSSKTIRALSLYVIDEMTQVMEPEQMSPYLDSIITKLIHVLQSSTPGIQKMALDAIGSVALGAKEGFVRYFPSIIELIQPLWNITHSKFYFLRGASIECVGYLATALGKDVFRPYLAGLMPHVLASLEFDDSELKEQSMVYMINVAGIFKEEFAPFLEPAATHALSILESVDGISLVDDDEQEDGWDSSDDENGKGQHISIRTDAMNTKVRALNAVEAFALNCGAHFEPYIPRFMHAIAGLTDYLQEDVRASSVEALAALVLCSFNAAHPGPQDVQIWVRGEINPGILTSNNKIVLEPVLKSIVEESLEDPEEVVISKSFDAIQSILERVGPTALVDHMDAVMAQVKKVLLHQHDCQTLHEEEDEDESDEEASSVIGSATELICQFGKCYGEHFVMKFNDVYPELLRYCTSLRPVADRTSVIGCFAEVLPALGPCGINYVESIFPIVIQGLASDHADLKLNCAFCLGILAEISGDNLAPAYQQMLQALHPLFESEKNEDRIIDNAAAAVARMIITSTAHVPLSVVFPVFLDALPLKTDFEENATVYKCLNGLVRSKHNDVLVQLPKILQVYAKALCTESNVSEDVKKDIALCMKDVFASFEQQVKEIVSQLNSEYQSVLVSALQ